MKQSAVLRHSRQTRWRIQANLGSISEDRRHKRTRVHNLKADVPLDKELESHFQVTLNVVGRVSFDDR